jgi:hypothetical protein
VSPPAAAPNVQAADQSSTARPPLQVLQGNTAVAAAAADDRNMYSEVHDSGGSRVYVSSSHSTSEAVPARRPPGRNSSFRRAVHHPPGEALPRIMSNTGEPAECDADANARLFAHWGISGSVTAGSMCSLVSQGTWATNGTATSGTDTAGSNGTDDTGGSILDEVETVFNMTGGADAGGSSNISRHVVMAVVAVYITRHIASSTTAGRASDQHTCCITQCSALCVIACLQGCCRVLHYCSAVARPHAVLLCAVRTHCCIL